MHVTIKTNIYRLDSSTESFIISNRSNKVFRSSVALSKS